MADETAGILSAPPPPSPEEMGEAPSSAPEQPAAPPRDQSGRFQPRDGGQSQAADQPSQPDQHAEPEDPRDKELRGLKAALAEIRGELRQYKQPQEVPKEPEAPAAPPDPDADPIAYMKHVAAENERLKQAWEAQQRGQQLQTIEAQAGQYLQTQLEAFKAERPDVEDALTYAIEAGRRAGAEHGMHPQQIEQALRQELVQIALQAEAWGLNPGQIILARAMKAGYQPVAQPPAGASAEPPQPAPAPQPPRPPQPVSLSRVTGGAPNSGSVMNPMHMSYKEIGKLSDAEFAKLNGIR